MTAQTPLTESHLMNCQEYISSAILEAARGAVPADAERLMLLPDCGPRNKPLIPLLVGLVEALKVTAVAVADNAWDEGCSIDAQLAAELQQACIFARTQISTAGLVPKKP